MKSAFIFFYFALLCFISFYGIHLYWLIALYLKHRRKPVKPAGGRLGRDDFPRVTVQLPIYNEQRVAVRLIEAVRRFDWPDNKFEIQILDDSTDITSQLISEFLATFPDEGPKTQHVRRTNREGFKAGALKAGLVEAQGEFIAIFDADNFPRPDFLTSTIPFFNNRRVGMVQTRWSFLNRTESFLCRAQALFLDAHFNIEQQARFHGGLLFNFNGTAGVWRRSTIEQAGGWKSDTLTEDFDLSIRAQVSGAQFVYLNDYYVPTELPNSISAFKSQQYRWSKGAVQTGLNLFPKIVRSSLPIKAKVASFFHFSSKALSVALLMLALMLIPALYFRLETGMMRLFLVDLPIFVAATGSMSLFYSLAYRSSMDKRSFRDTMILPVLTSLGVALAVNNTRAFFSALSGRKSAFVRTPKSGSTEQNSLKAPQTYLRPSGRTAWVESFLALYSLTAMALAVQMNLYFTLPFLATFFAGYFYFSFKGIKDAIGR
jgi:cellulose synthase/poly-beta-1,6-N-acetylglucosamine synthase-like glycosyltransferase